MKINRLTQKDTARAVNRQAQQEADNRVYVTLHHLLRLQHKAFGFSFLPRQPLSSLLSGRHASRLRGRGLNFEEMRAYQHGDDIRSIDWKVTARTGKPHVRVFTEERERPAMLLVDQRIAMFYGTKVNLKSVTAAEAAALGAWTILASGDRVGVMVFNDTEIVEIPPQRSRRNVMQILRSIVDMNHALRVDLETPPNPEMINRVLGRAERIVGHDYQLGIISDFEGADETTRRHLMRLGHHNDVIAFLVHDPSATTLIQGGNYVFTDGELHVEMKMRKGRVRRKVLKIAKGRITNILSWQQEVQMPILPLNTEEDTAEQIRRMLGHLQVNVQRV